MNNPHMLYRCPGPETFEGVACETTVVEVEEVESHLAAGWHRNWIEAGEARIKANEETMAEIDSKLAQLKAVHKGRGVWEVQDAEGKVIASGLTKEQAQAKVG